MKDGPLQCPPAGSRPSAEVVPPRHEPERSRFASFFALFLLLAGLSVHGVAPSIAEGYSLVDATPAVMAAAEVVTEPAQWCAVVHDAPELEDPALEPELNEEPAAPDALGVIRLAFGCTSIALSSGEALQVASGSYNARFATSPVLARAPPRQAC